MAKMRVAHVPKAGADFEIAEREIPQPGTGEVNEAYARMMSGKAEFRVVLTMGGSSRAPRAPAVETVAGEQWPQERAAPTRRRSHERFLTTDSRRSHVSPLTSRLAEAVPRASASPRERP